MHIGFHKTFCKSTFQCHNPKGLKLIKRLWLGLSHLRFHKLKYSFEGTLNPICNCGTVETTVHYLFHCSNFSNGRITFFNKLHSIDGNIISKDNSNISKLLLYGDHSFNGKKKYFYFSCFNWIQMRFDALLFRNSHIYLSMCKKLSRNCLLINFI